MRRRILVFLALIACFLVGAILASGPFPDYTLDLWLDLLVQWKRYHINAGTTGIVFLMLSGYLCLHGVYLLCRNLWRGLLHGVRERVATADAGRDQLTGLPSRFALNLYLDRSIEWAREDPSTHHVTIALFKLVGLEKVNELGGTMRGDELLRGMSLMVHEAAVSRALLGFARWLTRLTLRPASILFGTPMPARCPVRFSGATFAMGMSGQDPRDAFIYVGELLKLWTEHLKKLEPDVEVKVVGSLALRTPMTTTEELLEGARQALVAAEQSGEVVVALSMTEGGSAPMVKEFQDVKRVDLPPHRERPEEEEILTKKKKKPGLNWRLWAGAKAWGPMVFCFAAVPLLLLLGQARGAPHKLHHWPDTVKSVPVVGTSGVKHIDLLRATAGPSSDGVLQVKAYIIQMDTSTPLSASSPNIAQVKVEITNLSGSHQHLNMFDISAIDRKDRKLSVDAGNTLRFANPLSFKTLPPEGKWSAWMRFVQRDTPIRALILEPSRHSKLLLTFKENEPAADDKEDATPKK